MSFHIEPNDKFFQIARCLVEHETAPASTIRFWNLVDLSEVESIRQESLADGIAKPGYTAFVVKAVATALREHPYANRRAFRSPWLGYLGFRLQQFHQCDVAVAVEPDPAGKVFTAFIEIIRDADKKSLMEIDAALRQLRDGNVDNNAQWQQFRGLVTRLPWPVANMLIRLPAWVPSLWTKYRGGAALVSSPAKYGVDLLTANWSSPMAVSFGLVKKRPFVINGEVVARSSFYFLLNFDRRVMAGAPGARFFARVVEILTKAHTYMA